MKKLLALALIVPIYYGCGGGGGGSSQASFAGAYAGSFLSTQGIGSIGPATFTIDGTGNLAGTANDVISGGSFTLTGTVSSSGATSISVIPTSGSTSTVTGTLAFNGSGDLAGSLSSGSSTFTVTVNTSGRPLEYAGTYSGNFATTSGGNASGSVTMTINSSGGVTGTATSSGVQLSITGTISSSGVLDLTIPNGGNASLEGGSLAFNSSGLAYFYVSDNAGYSSGTMTKS